MKTIISLAIAIGACGVLASQDDTRDAAKKSVEAPVKKVVKSPEVEKFDLSKTGIEWHKGLDAVLGKGKPVLLLHILGNYDEVYC